MINEISRELTDWFNDGTHGVAAKLAAMTLYAGDSAPTIGTIADATRNDLVALKQPPSIPGIAVWVHEVPLLDGETVMVSSDGVADVLVRIARSNVNTETAVTETNYILRALLQSWRLFNHDTRVKNGIQIFACRKLVIAPEWTPIKDGIMTGGANGLMVFRDTETGI